MFGLGKKRSSNPLFLVEDYEVDRTIASLKHSTELTVEDVPAVELNFEDEKIYKAPKARAFEFEWNVILGVVTGKVYKIALHWDGEDRTTAGILIHKIVKFAEGLYGKAADDNGQISVWDAHDGNMVLETNCMRPAACYYVNGYLTSNQVATFTRRKHKGAVAGTLNQISIRMKLGAAAEKRAITLENMGYSSADAKHLAEKELLDAMRAKGFKPHGWSTEQIETFCQEFLASSIKS